MKPVRYPFEADKARAAAEVLLSLDGGRMDELRLVKLLYLVEREALKRRGTPIFGGQLACLEHGPVPTDALRAVRTAAGVAGRSRTSIQHHRVELHVEPDEGPLSEWELEVLRDVHRLNEPLDTWQLVEATHQLDEWKDPGTGKSLPLDLGDVLRAVGRSETEVERLAGDADELDYMRSLGLW